MLKIQLTTKNIPMADDIKRITTEKLKKLEKRLVKFPEDAVKAIVMLKRRQHRSEDDIYVTTIALYVPSRILHAHQDGYTLEESLNGAIEDLEDQLERYKGKFEDRSG